MRAECNRPAVRNLRAERAGHMRMGLLAAAAAAAAASLTASCRPAAGTDASTTDTDAAPGPTLALEIANVSTTDNLFLDACLRCGLAFELWFLGGGAPEQIPLPSRGWDCLCDTCAGVTCQGIADPPVAWFELPPGGTLHLAWDGARYALEPGACPTGSGCLAGSPAASGPYELRINYTLRMDTSANILCPGGAPPWELLPYTDATGASEATLANCADLCLGTGCPSVPYDAIETVPFAWPDATTLRVELGGP